MYDLSCFNHGLKLQHSICNFGHNLTMLSVNICNIVIITITFVDYLCIINDISKSLAIDLLKNSVLEDRGYI